MNRVLTAILAICLTLVFLSATNSDTFTCAASSINNDIIIPRDEPTGDEISLLNPERLGTIIVTLLIPQIRPVVEDYYKEHLTITPTVEAYNDSFVSNINGDIHASKYEISVVVRPYIGPHIDVGEDKISFTISSDGKAIVTGYEHLKNYELPQTIKI